MSANETHVEKHAKPEISEQPLLQVEDLHLRFGGLNALSGVSFNVKKGHIQAIIGPNGAGKTCILNCICRFYQPYRGRVVFEGKDISKVATHRVAELGIARSFQNIELFKGMTVLDNIKLGHHVHMKTGFFIRRHLLGKAKRRRCGFAPRSKSAS
jgi:branched-chain amino acid transport system ATP-binding protein